MKQITVDIFKQEFRTKLKSVTAKPANEATNFDLYNALGGVVWDRLVDDWTKSNNEIKRRSKKQVFYFSMEFLVGRYLKTNLESLAMYEIAKQGLSEMGFDIDEIESAERDPGLGNGGLGRLAACFLDSLASLGYAGHGCGIRYNYGLFEQRIVDGYQVEFPDRWLTNRNVWEVRKDDKACVVEFGGRVEAREEDGRWIYETVDSDKIRAVPYDTPVVGFENGRVNNLRLFSAEATKNEFDFFSFSTGDYNNAFAQKHTAEAISQVLYPNDNYYEGRLLRVKQEYFMVSAGIQSIIRSYKKSGKPIQDFHKHIALHINDTHPTLMIPELMRIFVDIEGMEWEEAWDIVENSVSYTNHTILSEALEKWRVPMLEELLPRITMIIKEIDRRFVIELKERYGKSDHEIQGLRIIQGDTMHMANLCIVASHSVNGVARLHTQILKEKELNNLYKLYPYKFNNKTNGITHRRWLMYSNPALASFIDEAIGTDWRREPILMAALLDCADDKSLLSRLDQIKTNNKIKLAEYIKQKNNIIVDPNSIFDIQSKRLHEYKRQLLNILHVMHMYNTIMENPNADITPRTFIFGAKAAPAYHIAKQIIKLINTVSAKIERTPRVRDVIKVVFLENYNVSLAEIMIPAADVSEQISTASKEASGTGNMKFMMNGALTIGTLDGANVEIKEAVGDENIYIFGMTSDEVYQTYSEHSYRSSAIYEYHAVLRQVLDQLNNGFFEGTDQYEFQSIRDSLIQQNDSFFVLKDFDSYAQTQAKLGMDYRDRDKWLNMSLANIARSGIFSSDYTIKEYARQIWHL